MKPLGPFGTDVLGVTEIRDRTREIDGRTGRTCDDDRRVFGTPLARDPVAPVIVAVVAVHQEQGEGLPPLHQDRMSFQPSVVGFDGRGQREKRGEEAQPQSLGHCCSLSTG